MFYPRIRIKIRASLVAQLKESTCNMEDLGLIPGLGRSPGEGEDYPLQYSGLENSRDCRAPGIAKSQTRPSNFSLSLFFLELGCVLEIQSRLKRKRFRRLAR